MMHNEESKPTQPGSGPCRHRRPSASPSGLCRRLRGALALLALLACALSLSPQAARANVAGAVTATNTPVTLTDNGSTVTLANGTATIVIEKGSARLDSIRYTHSNGAAPTTTELLAGSGSYYNGGYWAGGKFTYSLAADSGDYVDVKLVSTASANPGNIDMEVHYCMLRGSAGFYTTYIMSHQPGEDQTLLAAFGKVTNVAETYDNKNATGPDTLGGVFNWVSQDETRSILAGFPSSYNLYARDCGHEMSIGATGTLAGQYADKFIYQQEHGALGAFGWSSDGPIQTTVGGGVQTAVQNIGIWTSTRLEFSDGGPMKRDVFAYVTNQMNNDLITNEFSMGGDDHFDTNESWTKVCGPWFTYLNSAPTSYGTTQSAQALFQDAQAQDAAEKAAWPYSWFQNPAYAPAAGRGTVTGQVRIADSTNSQASANSLWVGLIQQPFTYFGTITNPNSSPVPNQPFSVSGSYDFQMWGKPYQYWVKTDYYGNFTFPHVPAGQNYTLYAFGPGAAGTFVSHTLTTDVNEDQTLPPPTSSNQTLPLLECDLPTVQPTGLPAQASPQFLVNVTGGATTALGTVTWTPTRYGATVFELGSPDRNSAEFRHGEDAWAPQVAPQLGYPTPVWGAKQYFADEFPNGVNYTVGSSHWATDWNYILPSMASTTYNPFQPAQGTINFTLAQVPAGGATGSIYLGCASSERGGIEVDVNGTNLGTASGVVAAPSPLTSSGFTPTYSDDTDLHCATSGPFSDERINFPGSLLHAGQNTITIKINWVGPSDFLMTDYVRLELSGYSAPPPSTIQAYAGNNRILVTWPAVPGAIGYNLLRSSTLTGNYGRVAGEVSGKVCGDSGDTVTYTDTTAANGTPYYYEVQTETANSHSANSAPSAVVTPSANDSTSAPAAPSGLTVTSGHQTVSLNWNASPGAGYYTAWRTTLHADNNNGLYPLRTIPLGTPTTGTSYTDDTPTDGTTYGYYVVATSAAGSSAPSATVNARPLPAPPATAPANLTSVTSTNTQYGSYDGLSWSPVPGATGYVIYRSTTPGVFTFPADFEASLRECVFGENGCSGDTHLVSGTTYYYRVTAVNAGGISPPATISVVAK